MASPTWSPQSSTIANSKRKASAIPLNSPPRRPMPPWNTKMDTLGHCYEGELAEDKRKSLGEGAIDSFMAKIQNDATRQRRVSELKSKSGISRDAVMANLRLPEEAHQRLSGSSRDVHVRYGKEQLALGDILPVFDKLSTLWQGKDEKSVVNLEKRNATLLVEQNRLCKERDRSIEQMEIAQREREKFKERDALDQEKDRFPKESEMLKQDLQVEKESLRQRLNEREEAVKEMAPQATLREAERKNRNLVALADRYRQERNDARQQSDSLRKEIDRYQTQLEEVEEEAKKAKKQLSSSNDLSNRIHIQLTNFLALDQEHALRRQRTELQGTNTRQLQWQRKSLEDGHNLLVQNMAQGWKQEKAQLVASASADRDVVSEVTANAKLLEASHSAALNSLKLSREATARNQETIRDLVIAIATSLSSYDDMHDAFLRRGRIIINGIDRTQELKGRLTDLQERFAKSESKSKDLRKKLYGKEKELRDLSTANDANILSLREIQNVHAVCEYDQQLQLGRINRHTFFDNCSEFAGSLSEKGRIFKAEESCRDIDVCFCILRETNEALCVIRRSGAAFTVWHSKLEDCSTFSYAWRSWLCLGGEDQGKPIYMCLANSGESKAWLQKNLSVRKLGSEELDRFK